MPKPLLVETVTGRTMSEVETSLASVSPYADMVELRLDGVADVDLRGLIPGRRQPVIVTVRPTWEGGRFDGSEEERYRLLDDALGLGAEYIDLEWRAGFASLIRATDGKRIVISMHDYEGVPSDLPARVYAMRQTGAEVVKVAVTARSLADTLPLRDLGGDGKTVSIAMGDAGTPTRLLPAHFGSCWTYAGAGMAPGQIHPKQMVEDYNFRGAEADRPIYGVVGRNALTSTSPRLHNTWFQQAGIRGVYVPLQTATFDDFLAFAAALPVAGASVTIPFKLDALRCAVRADETARRVGAANTLRRAADGWEAMNTDVAGFLAPLNDEDVRGARVAILGAGGAARAVAVAVVSRGGQPTIHARRRQQAIETAADVGALAGEWPAEPGSWDVLVNCTPLGGRSSSEESPLPEGPFTGRLVYDLIYGGETRLLRDARQAGLRTIDGLPMLIAQARKQFEWWTQSVCA